MFAILVTFLINLGFAGCTPETLREYNEIVKLAQVDQDGEGAGFAEDLEWTRAARQVTDVEDFGLDTSTPMKANTISDFEFATHVQPTTEHPSSQILRRGSSPFPIPEVIRVPLRDPVALTTPQMDAEGDLDMDIQIHPFPQYVSPQDLCKNTHAPTLTYGDSATGTLLFYPLIRELCLT